ILGDRHKLEVIDIFNDDATLNGFGLHYEGKDRFVARKEIVIELKALGALSKIETHTNKVGTSERTGAVIEPKLSDQWFLKMKELSRPALKAVLDKEVNLVPEKYINTYRHWVENVRDWNISRQLWWGQQIPAYYYGDGKEDFVVAENVAEAVKLANKKRSTGAAPPLTAQDLKQDPDALDTWFSSWLWPISVFNGVLQPDNPEINYYYPTNDLVTAPEILFFWVARMIVAGYEYRGEKPFNNVYLTGIVRDKQRRKMSKSLGNSPDPIKLIEKYGADGVRVGMLLCSPAGNDLMFDEGLCKQGGGFVNKIWNAHRLIAGWGVSHKIEMSQTDATALQWYRAKFEQTLVRVEDHYSKYRISDALMATYKLIWDDFCSWLLEMVKPAYGQPIAAATFAEVIKVLENNLKILHPFVPFVSEEIWQRITARTPGGALIVARWPEHEKTDEGLITHFDFAAAVIAGVRTVRKEKNIPFKEKITLAVINNEGAPEKFNPIIAKLGNVAAITTVSEPPEGAVPFRVKSNEYFVPVAGAVNSEAEIAKLTEELGYAQGFLRSVRGKLKNEKFVKGAPPQVVANERKKEADALAKIETIMASLRAQGV
ncbi:MAG: class I tRNA ligase family protein, partial [Marinirhabdus sp.]